MNSTKKLSLIALLLVSANAHAVAENSLTIQEQLVAKLKALDEKEVQLKKDLRVGPYKLLMARFGEISAQMTDPGRSHQGFGGRGTLSYREGRNLAATQQLLNDLPAERARVIEEARVATEQARIAEQEAIAKEVAQLKEELVKAEKAFWWAKCRALFLEGNNHVEAHHANIARIKEKLRVLTPVTSEAEVAPAPEKERVAVTKL